MEVMEELSVAEKEDAEEVKKWKGLSQNEIDQCRKNLAERKEKEVLDKYKVEETNKEAFKGSGAPLEWRTVRKKKKGKIQSKRVARGKNFSLFRQYHLQRQQSKQEDLTEVGEMKQQQRMAIIEDLIRNIRSKGRMNAKNRWCVSELLAADCEKGWIHTGWEDTLQK